ncbi:hypothetical protein AC579_2396, partial [Pseudocercospora musae]
LIISLRSSTLQSYHAWTCLLRVDSGEATCTPPQPIAKETEPLSFEYSVNSLAYARLEQVHAATVSHPTSLPSIIYIICSITSFINAMTFSLFQIGTSSIGTSRISASMKKTSSSYSNMLNLHFDWCSTGISPLCKLTRFPQDIRIMSRTIGSGAM